MERKAIHTIIKHLPKKQHTILIGARQVGKTTLLKQTLQHLKQNKIFCYYISFENPEILQKVNQHPENIFEFALHPEKTTKRIYILIDEIQYANDPSNLLKYLYDQYEPHLKVIATGSSAFYIDQHFKDSLAGRKKIIHIHPLSFDEFIVFKGQKMLADELVTIKAQKQYTGVHKNELQQFLYEYLTYGGYPAVILADTISDKEELLNELKSSFLKKDILESDIENEHKFYQLITILASQTGAMVNKHELANTLGIAHKTIERYLFVLQKCFHIQLLKPFHQNVRKEISKMPKVYFNDHGLRNSFINNFSPMTYRPDKGALLENLLVNHLREKYEPEQLHYWRTADGNEVDFVVETSYNEGFAIETKWNEREFKPGKYQKFKEAYKNFKLKCSCMETDIPANWVLKDMF